MEQLMNFVQTINLSTFNILGSENYLYFSYLPGKPDNPITTHDVAGINLDVRPPSLRLRGQIIIKLVSSSELTERPAVSLPGPAHPGQHWEVPVRGQRGGPDVRHGQRLRRPPGCGGSSEWAQDYWSSQKKVGSFL